MLIKIKARYLQLLIASIFVFFSCQIVAQTWVDSLDSYLRDKHLPASKFYWSWQHSTALYGVIAQLELRPEKDQKQ